MPSFKSLSIDKKKENEGVWVRWHSGIEVKLARIDNAAYRAATLKISRKHKTEFQNNVLTQVEQLNLVKKPVAQYILLDWKNVTDDDGNPITYSPEEGLKVFNDPTLEDFYHFVITACQNRDLFMREELDEDLGNSEDACDGTY